MWPEFLGTLQQKGDITMEVLKSSGNDFSFSRSKTLIENSSPCIQCEVRTRVVGIFLWTELYLVGRDYWTRESAISKGGAVNRTTGLDTLFDSNGQQLTGGGTHQVL